MSGWTSRIPETDPVLMRCKTRKLSSCAFGIDIFGLQEQFMETAGDVHSMGCELASVNESIGLLPVESLVCILQQCRKSKNLVDARRLLAHLCNSGLEAHLALGNYIVPMFIECEGVLDAEQAFGRLAYGNQYSWASLIQGYIECRESDHAFRLYRKMQEIGVKPSSCTFLGLLKVCSEFRLAERGQEMHAEIVYESYESDLFIGSSLVDMYAKCNMLIEAQEIFNKLANPDVVLWTTLIDGYVETGKNGKALSIFKQMQLEGRCPNAHTFSSILKACIGLGAIGRGQELHTELVKQGSEGNMFIASTLVDMYAKSGWLLDAQGVFGKATAQDVVLWNALIGGYSELGRAREVLNLFNQMQLLDVEHDTVTFTYSLKACGSLKAINKGQQIHKKIIDHGLEADNKLGNALVDMYIRCGQIVEALEVSNKLSVHDVVLWNILITGYLEHGLYEEVLSCLKVMQMECVCVNYVTYLCSVKACGNLGAIDTGQGIHTEVINKGYERESFGKGDLHAEAFLPTALIDMYSKCGSMLDAQHVFDAMPTRLLVSWNALLTGYAHQGRSKTVLELYNRMEKNGIQPDEVTFLNILTVCSHDGLIVEGLNHLQTMSDFHTISPSIKHHSCMVDMLCRAGQLVEAVAVMKRMPYQPDLVMCSTFMDACRQQGNVEIGRYIFEWASGLDETHQGSFVSMVNLYSSAYMWEDAMKVESIRRGAQSSHVGFGPDFRLGQLTN